MRGQVRAAGNRVLQGSREQRLRQGPAPAAEGQGRAVLVVGVVGGLHRGGAVRVRGEAVERPQQRGGHAGAEGGVGEALRELDHLRKAVSLGAGGEGVRGVQQGLGGVSGGAVAAAAERDEEAGHRVAGAQRVVQAEASCAADELAGRAGDGSGGGHLERKEVSLGMKGREEGSTM